MKITMYELLGLVKDGKAPKKIKYINSIWEYDKDSKDYFSDYYNEWLIYAMNSIGLIEREVEIIEEEKKIPEKLYLSDYEDTTGKFDYDVLLTINEIIDYLDYLKSKGE